MNAVSTVARLLLGLVFLVFGLNGFLHFIPNMPMPDAAVSFFMAMGATGYMLPLLSTTRVIGGVLLLSVMYVPLGLALLAPVVVNTVLFHMFLALGGLLIALIVAALELFLAWRNGAAFAGMLRAK